jgi:hypothetical protein
LEFILDLLFSFILKWHKKVPSWIFGIIAIVFNPIYPLYLGKELWQIVDAISGIAILSSILIFKFNKENVSLEEDE